MDPRVEMKFIPDARVTGVILALNVSDIIPTLNALESECETSLGEMELGVVELRSTQADGLPLLLYVEAKDDWGGDWFRLGTGWEKR